MNRLHLSLLAWLLWPILTFAQARDIHETLIRIPVSAANREGSLISADIPVTLFRPDGPGPFPLVVINHGRATTPEKRAEPKIQRQESAARFFVRKGFAVAVPTRLGYGETLSVGDPERSRGSCSQAEYADAMRAGAAQVLTVIDHLREQSWVDAQRIVLVGQSVGGFVSTAANASRPPGLLTVINFAGGSGGNPETHPGVPCAGNNAGKTYASFGRSAQAPMLWVYTENDRFFDPAHSRAWHAAYTEAGGQAEYRLLPAFGEDGHTLFARGNDIWQPIVDDYLVRFGFTTPGTLTATSSDFAAVEDGQRVPYIDHRAVSEGYARFLAAKLPRAFAIGSQGGWGWASGDDSLSRALAACQGKNSTRCKLYAVDDAVVWR